MGRAKINVRTRACSRTFYCEVKTGCFDSQCKWERVKLNVWLRLLYEPWIHIAQLLLLYIIILYIIKLCNWLLKSEIMLLLFRAMRIQMSMPVTLHYCNDYQL